MLDGVEVLAPRCRFFKDWVRQDTARSPRGAGFRYTAIAYPGHGEKPAAYFFALDPEYAVPRNLHLYDLWVTLQIEEGPQRVAAPDQNPRTDVVARAADCSSGLWDPWFDGNNYAATIVVSPRRGAGPNLTHGRFGPTTEEDPVLRVAARWIGRSFYKSTEANGTLFSWRSGGNEMQEHHLRGDIETGWKNPHWGTESLLFAQVDLKEILPTGTPEFEPACFQIGEDLWRLIATARSGFPPDFRARHLVRGDDWILVWNRRGIAVASKRPMTELARDVETVARILERVDRNLHGAANGAQPAARINDSLVKERLADSQWTLEQVTALERKCRSDEGRAIRPFLEAVGLSTVARDVDALNNLYRDTLETRRDNMLTDVLAIGSFLALAISWMQALDIKPVSWGPRLGHLAWAVLLLMGIAYALIRLRGTRWFPWKKRQ
jgi:hypothetical protein